MYEYTPSDIFAYGTELSESKVTLKMIEYIESKCKAAEIPIIVKASPPDMFIQGGNCTCHTPGYSECSSLKCARSKRRKNVKIYFNDIEDAMAFKLIWE